MGANLFRIDGGGGRASGRPKAGNVRELLDYIGYVFLHGAMSSNLAQAATDAANAATTATTKAQAALYIVLTSSEYQVVQ